MDYIVPHYIAGNARIEPSDYRRTLYNPVDGQSIGHVDYANTKICDEAVAAAKKAGVSWSETSPIKRAQILLAFRELLNQQQQDLARIITREHGKTYDDAKGSIARAIEAVEYYCGRILQPQGTYSNNIAHNVDCFTLTAPLGVCVGVSPFNFPVMVPIWMMIPAIACGNTFILKPSEQDPSASVRLFELLTDAGLPPGVVNCVHGDKLCVDYLLQHPDVTAVTAVGSTAVAKAIYTTATTRGIRAHTFGSAKNHAVVMPDADINNTAKAIVSAAFGAAGERCMAISVVVVVGTETANNLLLAMTPLIHAIKIDAGDAPGCEMGPLISLAHRQRVIDFINQGVADGALLCIDGRDFKHPKYPHGYFLGASVFDNVTADMSIYQEEIFGPVLVMMRVSTLDEAILLVNKHQYGNGTAIFTQVGAHAREYTQRVHVGMVGINIPIPVPITSHPFGGWKNSSFGGTNMHGDASMHFYTRQKTVTSKWPELGITESSFSMPTHK